MQSRDFCYWLQGYFEIEGSERTALNPEKVDIIKKHLAMVFVHEIDPSMGEQKHQATLNTIHSSNLDPNKFVARC